MMDLWILSRIRDLDQGSGVTFSDLEREVHNIGYPRRFYSSMGYMYREEILLIDSTDKIQINNIRADEVL